MTGMMTIVRVFYPTSMVEMACGNLEGGDNDNKVEGAVVFVKEEVGGQ